MGHEYARIMGERMRQRRTECAQFGGGRDVSGGDDMGAAAGLRSVAAMRVGRPLWRGR